MASTSRPEAVVSGVCDSQFALVRQTFVENFAQRGEVGAAVAVSVEGKLLVDLWGGSATSDGRAPWRRDTLVNAFSVGKGLTSLCPLLLAERGLLDLDAPVARYWPAFAAAGKEAITTRQILCHRAGLPAIREPLPQAALFDWQRMTSALAAQAPYWEPGSLHGYHVNTFGFLIGEIVRRISGRSLGAFLREEIASPLDADVHLGLDAAAEARVAELIWFERGENRATTRPEAGGETLEMLHHAYFNPPGFSGNGTVNTSAWRRAEIPSANCHANARGVARVYSVLAAGGTLEGTELLGRERLREAVTEHSVGADRVLGIDSRFGLGFQLPQPGRPLGKSPNAFGHFGAGGALGFADPDARLAFGYTMNKLGPRWQSPTTISLVDAVYACI